VPKPAQAYEPKVPVKMREWIAPALATPGFAAGLHGIAENDLGLIRPTPGGLAQAKAGDYGIGPAVE